MAPSPKTATSKTGRKRKGSSGNATTTTRKTKKSTTTTTTTTTDTTNLPSGIEPTPAPIHTLILDNGGDTIKYGWATDNTPPKHIPNITARLPQQVTVLAGDEVCTTVQNPNSLIYQTRSTERGIITNLTNQIQVWKRLLDILNIIIPLNTETANAFHWVVKNTTSNNKKATKKKGIISNAEISSSETAVVPIPSNQCAVLIALPPFYPRSLLDQIMLIWMEDFGFSHVGFCLSSIGTAIADKHKKQQNSNNDNNNDLNVMCVVDLGWSATYIIPTYNGKVINKSSIRRVPIGAIHLINIWKYHCSYRQWNLMDSEWIIRDVFEKTSIVSMQYNNDMKLAQRTPSGRRYYDLEYILPDYDQTNTGTVRIPLAVQIEIEKKKKKEQQQQQQNQDDDDEEEDDDYNEEEDEDYVENDNAVDNDKDDDVADLQDEEGAILAGEDDASSNDDDDDDDDDESPEELRKRILKQREEEERKRRELEAQQQILRISVERFAIPEALFRPSDVGLPAYWAGIPAAIVQSIELTPPVYQAGLYSTIRLTGGLSMLTNLKERLECEVRALAPCHYPLQVTCSDSPINESWLGIRDFVNETKYSDWSVSNEEWEKSYRRGAWKKFLQSEGGCLI